MNQQVVPLPPWLSVELAQTQSSVPTAPPVEPLTMKQLREARELNFSIMFERLLPMIENGRTLKSLLMDIKDNEPYIEIDQFRKWIHSNAKRKERYYEARTIGAECVEDELIGIADAAGNALEDVQRSKLRIDTRRWLLGVWDRNRYGDKTEVTNTGGGQVVINIEGYTVPALQQGVTIEGEIDG